MVPSLRARCAGTTLARLTSPLPMPGLQPRPAVTPVLPDLRRNLAVAGPALAATAPAPLHQTAQTAAGSPRQGSSPCHHPFLRSLCHDRPHEPIGLQLLGSVKQSENRLWPLL